MASEEYEAYCKELDDAEKADGESSPPKQVFATLACLYEDEEDNSEKTLPQAVIPDTLLSDAPPRVCTRRMDQPTGRTLNFQDGKAAESLMQMAGENGELIQQKEILTNPITLEVAADPEAF
jgi:hypothetical protein